MKRKVDLFEYNDNDGVGRLRTTTPSQEIAIAEKLEANMMTKAQFNALSEERKANRAGSGFDEMGYSRANSDYATINHGITVRASTPNIFWMGWGANYSASSSKTREPVVNVNGVISKINYTNSTPSKLNEVILPTSPNIYPYDTVLTTEQINSGVIKHADSSNSGLIVNGKFDTDTSGWTASIAGVSHSWDNGTVKITAGYGDRYIYQALSCVIGKNYIIEFNAKNTDQYGNVTVATTSSYGTPIATRNITTNSSTMDRYTLEFTATATTMYIRLKMGGANSIAYFDNVAVYPSDAISRSDLVFLESWHEDVSEKNFVYDNGNTQSLSTANIIGVTPTNGSFTGFETYSLFGNWQTSSALIGKGYVWSNLTEAQKKAFIANPDNNCYLDGDKVIQVRYRVRVVQGLGDSWEYPFNNMVDGGGSNTVGSTVTYSINNNLYPKPKGKKVSISFDINSYSGGETGFFANKNYKNVTTAYEVGMATAVNKSTNSLDTTVGYEGKCYALPIALVHKKNSGMYHPVYNPNGTKKAVDGNFWYNTTETFTSISDCFNPSKLLTASGYIGTVSGRPDGLFYDQIHESDILDLRNSSKKVEDYNRLISREFNKLVAGTYRGKESEWANISFGTMTSTVKVNNTWVYGSVETRHRNLPVKRNFDRLVFVKASDGTWYSAGSSYSDSTSLNIYFIDSVTSSFSSSTDYMIIEKSTRTKSNTLLHCDIIGNVTNYPTNWKQSGVFGTPLIVAEDGTSLLPDGAKDTFKLSRKANATPLLCLRSTDNGATWTSFTPTFSTTTNEITLTDEPANNLVMVYYQTHTSMAVPVANSEVLEIGDIFSGNSYESLHGASLINSLLNKVPIGYGKSQGYKLENYELFGNLFWNNTARAPIHKTLTFNQFETSNPAVKVLPYLSRLNGKAYLNLIYKELKHNGTSWGDDNKFNTVDNVSTTTDNNAQTILIGQKTVELPYFIGADE